MRPRGVSSDDVGQYPLHRQMTVGSPLSLVPQPQSQTRPFIHEYITRMHAFDPAIIHSQDAAGLTPLHVAAGLMNKQAVDTLLLPEIGGSEDLQRRDNPESTTPLEALEFSMRSNEEFSQAMLEKDQAPYPDAGLRCAYALRKAMGENVGTEASYIKLKRWGCTCNQCTDGWFSPRFRYRMQGA